MGPGVFSEAARWMLMGRNKLKYNGNPLDFRLSAQVFGLAESIGLNPETAEGAAVPGRSLARSSGDNNVGECG